MILTPSYSSSPNSKEDVQVSVAHLSTINFRVIILSNWVFTHSLAVLDFHVHRPAFYIE